MGLTKIEWTSFPRPDGTFMPGYTANLWWGCTKVHKGCDHCYAETLSNRWGFNVWGNDTPRKEIKNVWKDLDRYQRDAAAAGEMRSVFVGSMMDIFEKPMPLTNSKGELYEHVTTHDQRWRFFTMINDGHYSNLLFLLLTKRPSNINKYIPESWKTNPPPNVMFGTSPVNQATANKLIPQLLEVKGKKFLSVEPQLGWVSLEEINKYSSEEINCLTGSATYSTSEGVGAIGLGEKIDWVIVGGESGPGRREFNPEWARQIRDQCNHYHIPFFMKQWDKVKEIPDDLLIRQFP